MLLVITESYYIQIPKSTSYELSDLLFKRD